MPPKIGMRNIKTTLSVFICLAIFKVIERDAVLACVAAVICVQPTVENSIESGVSRILGTLIGGFFGVIFLFIIDAINHSGYLNENYYIFIVPLGIIAIIEICVLINRKGASAIACIVYLIIMISKKDTEDYLLYPISRAFDTIVGISVALLVNRYLRKPKIFSKEKEENISSDSIDNNDDNISYENTDDKNDIDK